MKNEGLCGLCVYGEGYVAGIGERKQKNALYAVKVGMQNVVRGLGWSV
jgi:hypothetical protein